MTRSEEQRQIMRKRAGRNGSPGSLPLLPLSCPRVSGCFGQAGWLVYGQMNCFYRLVSPSERGWLFGRTPTILPSLPLCRAVHAAAFQPLVTLRLQPAAANACCAVLHERAVSLACVTPSQGAQHRPPPLPRGPQGERQLPGP